MTSTVVKGWGMSNGYWAHTCPRDTGHRKLFCLAAVLTRLVPNVALRSQHKTGMECFMGRLGKLSPSHWCRLALNLALKGPGGGVRLSHDKCVVADSALDFVTACALHTMLVHT